MKRKITLMLLTLICETPIYNMYMEEVDIFCDNSKRKKRLTEGINCAQKSNYYCKHNMLSPHPKQINFPIKKIRIHEGI